MPQRVKEEFGSKITLGDRVATFLFGGPDVHIEHYASVKYYVEEQDLREKQIDRKLSMR